MKKRVLSVGGIVAIGIGVWAAVSVGTKEAAPLSVETETVGRHTIVQTVNATGRIQPKTQVRISADVSARITAIHVEEGELVEKGRLLVELDRDNFEAAVQSAQANVRSAQANANLVKQNLNRTRKDLERTRNLIAQKLESDAVLDTETAAHEVEAARYQANLELVEQARAALRQAEDAQSKTRIFAPMTGTISDLNKEVGEIAIGSQFQEDMILVVADLTAMEAQVNVDENDIVQIELQQQASIEVDALFGEKLAGTVYEIANTANEQQPGAANQKIEFEVKIAISGDTKRLRPGMTASADISTKTKTDAIGVPIQSVAVRTIDQLTLPGEEVSEAEKRFTADEDGFVQVVFIVEDGKALARQVETGIQSRDLIEITSGVDAGETVVVGPYRAISTDIENGGAVTLESESDD